MSNTMVNMNTLKLSLCQQMQNFYNANILEKCK
jgi:hypothetical protein